MSRKFAHSVLVENKLSNLVTKDLIIPFKTFYGKFEELAEIFMKFPIIIYTVKRKLEC